MAKKKSSKGLPRELTSVTKTSKIVALIMFATLPILGFLFGMRYQAQLDQASPIVQEAPVSQSVLDTPTPTQAPY